MHLSRISKIRSLKRRLWHINKRKTVQWKKTTCQRQQFIFHAIFTQIYFLRVRHLPEHFKEGETMQLLRISKIPRLKTRLQHSDKRETTQWTKTTRYRQQSHIQAPFTLIYFTRVRHPRGNFEKGKTMHLLRISKILILKTRLWHIAKRDTMQWKTTT